MCHVLTCCEIGESRFRKGTSDLSQAQNGGLELSVGSRGSERGPGSYDEPNVELVPHS